MTALLGAVRAATPLAAATKSATMPEGKFDFDTPYNRLGTDCIKWDYPKRVLHMDHIVAGMGVADMDFRCAPSITKALQERIQHESWGYLDLPQNFVDGVVAWNKRRYGLEIKPESVGITTGVHPGIIATLQAFCPPGSKVLLTTPVYAGFYGDLTYTNTKPEESLMKFSNGKYSIDFEDFERRISHDTNAFILCNPHNPTGNMWTREDLTRLGEICLRRRVLVLADEIHCDFVAKGQKYVPFASLENRDIVNNSITFKAASKSFSLAAMKCAWFFSTNADIVAAVKKKNRADLSTLGMVAVRGAYSGGEEWLNQCVSYIDGNHEFVQEYFRGNPMNGLVKVAAKPEGTYLTWLDCTGLAEKIGAKEMAEEARKAPPDPNAFVLPSPETMMEQWFAKHARVALVPGTPFGKGSDGHMRMNIATSRKTLKMALDSITEACKKA